MHRYVVVTGRPGVGKTTLFNRVVEELTRRGYRVVGFTCPEVRVAGRRVGFKIRGLGFEAEEWLARVDGCSGPRVGRYRVCPEAGRVAEEAARRIREADIIAIDEVGPMELKLEATRRAILEAIRSGKPCLLVVHAKLRDPEILEPLRREGVWFTVTLENRDMLPPRVLEAALEALGGAEGRGVGPHPTG